MTPPAADAQGVAGVEPPAASSLSPRQPRPARDLFTQEQLAAHAAALARDHRLSPDPRSGRELLPQVEAAARRLEEAYLFLTADLRRDAPTVGSEDWLRDNYHVVQDQVREIRQDLSEKFYAELPKLSAGAYNGYPRVYPIARDLVAYTAGRFDVDALADFVSAYQRVTTLSIGETWAVPIMLRIALLEELQDLTYSIVNARRARLRAHLPEPAAAAGVAPEQELARLLRTELRDHRRLSAPFVSELLLWLRDQPPAAAPAWQALQQALDAQGDSPEEMLRLEHQREAADQVGIGNVITSMRLLSSVDWPLFFDRVNFVEGVLRQDPSGAYAQMDFPTRDRYRHSVEQLAKRSPVSEQEIAQRVVALAHEAIETRPHAERQHHVGYYLISRGRFRLEQELGYRQTVSERISRFVFRHPVLGYLGSVSAATAAMVASLLAYAAQRGAGPAELSLVALITLLPASELAISLINLLTSLLITPRALPKLELKGGIPEHDRTLVVVPSIIESEARVETLLDDLEVRFLANREAHLHFALLSDFVDADAETQPADQRLIEAARRRVDRLNERYGSDRFFLLHRGRRWNAGEQRWMGWERKRGKLEELNRLLRGAEDTSFVVRHGETARLRSVRYVITLDSDTQLPIQVGRRLVGTLSHPLNRPRFDPALGSVTEGYGLLQPRIAVSLVSATRSTFASVFSGNVGLDPYTTAVSDVYQDLFHEGSYVGKGIYDVDAFEAAMANRVPENALLSHDLFEGFYVRAGLCTDIELVDDYPPDYLAYSARQHRWVRGDWQIARWLWRTVPDAGRQTVPNTLPVIARWKILDNLRRSLLPPALLLLLVLGWTVLPGSAWLWTGLALLVLAFPTYAQVARLLGSVAPGVTLRAHLSAERRNIVISLRQALFAIAMLPHQSAVMADAIGRVLTRMLLTRRHLLEWVSADRVRRRQLSLAGIFARMWPAVAVAAVVAIVVALVAPVRLWVALPVAVLWALSPVLARATSRSPFRRGLESDAEERRSFRRIARRTWLFFEELVTAEGHWLVPDNYQSDRDEKVAHRTSPTNIGLQLLSTLAAHDLGYIGTGPMLDRLEATLSTMVRMPRYRGHFYNWYDTRTLEPLSPLYISTVDSGNLAGHLLTLRAGMIEVVDSTPIVSTCIFDGIEDALSLFDDPLARIDLAGAERPIAAELAVLRTLCQSTPASLAEWRRCFSHLADGLSQLDVLVHGIEEGATGGKREADAASLTAAALAWLGNAAAIVETRQQELAVLAGWVDLLPFGIAPPDAPVPTLSGLAAWCEHTLRAWPDDGMNEARVAIEEARVHADELIDRAGHLGALADDLVEETEFGFLFNTERQLFAIGFNVSEGRPDNSHYDLLASEARLASFVAIATGKIPHDHWFKLGRSLTTVEGSRALISWSASMFEYLMPLLVMRGYPGTLLDETYATVVARQIAYGGERGVPWGVSESAYYAQDFAGNYQYKAFGVPGLGLKRGLGEDLVVAPYATVMAAPLAPRESLLNLQALEQEGLVGRYGFFDAIDYTPERLPRGSSKRGVPLPTYMAHHQGMSLLALANLLHDAPMQRRFHADPRVQAADLLLQERVPQLVPLKDVPTERVEHLPSGRRLPTRNARHYLTPHTLSPRTHLLSNGAYSVMVTNAGGGYSRCGDLLLTRWRPDITRDDWGMFFYVRDLDSGDVWSTTYQPVGKTADQYEVTFAPDHAVWRRVDGTVEIRTELAVSPEDNAELRRISITNHGAAARTLELTSYAEVVLAPGDADLAHPAFSKLFVETRATAERTAIVCARRPRTGTDRVYLVHVLSGAGRVGAPTQFETDRFRFVGRARTVGRPAALFEARSLSQTTGPVLDPIVSLRQLIRLPAGATGRVSFTTAFARSEEEAQRLVGKYQDRRAVARGLALASTHSEIERRQLGLSVDETLQFHRLASRLLYGDPHMRSSEAVHRATQPLSALWKHGISGDVAICLVRMSESVELPLFRDLLKAHEYLRLKGLSFDLVVLNEHGASYLQHFQEELQRLVESSPEHPWLDRSGGVFLRRADLMSAADQVLLQAAARVVMDGPNGRLHQQLAQPRVPLPFASTEVTANEPRVAPTANAVAVEASAKAGRPTHTSRSASSAALRPSPSSPQTPEALDLGNGLGGFDPVGTEYVIRVQPEAGALPPAPWANVAGHASFGFVASDLHPGFTWSGNSHFNRLTPWSNDPVVDPAGEALYLRDEDSRRYWSATPLPAGDGQAYIVRHGQGYTRWEHTNDELASALTTFVPVDQTVKVFRLELRNDSGRPRQVSLTLYVEWSLGVNRTRSALHVETSQDPVTGALMARNTFREIYPERVAFLDLSVGHDVQFDQADRESGRGLQAAPTLTGDRMEFIGRNRTLQHPAALRGATLSGRTGATLDPCGAVQVVVRLAPSETRMVIGVLGDAGTLTDAQVLVERYRNLSHVTAAFDELRQFWDAILGTVEVRTPDQAMDRLLNRWLLYQTLACRFFGRSGFYQSGGAFGFRDQLQDALALLHAAPQITRAHILRAAARQFVQGDVQHWWHEPGGAGTRTRFSDDRLWLVFATLEYVDATGDAAIFEEEIAFLESPALQPGEHERYETPAIAAERASLYEHCTRAIDLTLPTGVHGLPFIGIGDWNDGMNMVGHEGRGESVWLGWFLTALLKRTAVVAAGRGERGRAEQYRQHAAGLDTALEQAWDGQWYRRAYFDDGSPMGSAQNAECRIDAIAQSWAVLSGAADPARAQQAMAATEEHLVRRDARLVLLLTPPFDRSDPSPGYIQGYVPGVRENGGQYTHAAIWTVLAFARLGDGDRAGELFSLINPITHTRTPADIARYRAEPYVLAGDVYSMPPHVGRAGWTWYTGAAGWMYRVGVEAILGLQLRAGKLAIDPCIPRGWSGFEATVRRDGSTYHIQVDNPRGVCRGVTAMLVDGKAIDGSVVPLAAGMGDHDVRVTLG